LLEEARPTARDHRQNEEACTEELDEATVIGGGEAAVVELAGKLKYLVKNP
jgi:hypothetical protein